MLDDRPGRPLCPPGTRRRAVALLVALAASSSLASGQGGNGPGMAVKVYPDTSNTAESLLRNADNHARGGQFAEAIEIYGRVIQQFGDKVVLVPPEVPAEPVKPGAVGPEDSSLYVDARLDCQRRIAALPPEARALYRARVDSQAERWFKQGQAARDRGQLRRVVEQAFCSSWGDDALDLIGDLAFQEGQFVEALAAYRQIVPDKSTGGQGLVHPDPSVDLARVAAKKILCRAAIGADPPTKADVEAFAKAYPKAEGSLAGRTGSLATIVAEAVEADHLAAPPQHDGRWPTFAGASTRTKVAPGPIDVGSLQWKVDLAPIPLPGTLRFERRRMMSVATAPANVPPDRMLGYHPIVVGEQVIIADERHVTAYNLNRRPGEGGTAAVVPTWQHDHQGALVSEASRTTLSLARYTLTAFGDRIYARMGPAPSAAVTPGMGRFQGGMLGGGASPSYIVALDRAAEGKLLWKKSASEVALPRGKVGGRASAFEGTPVADARNVYVVLTERSEMTSSYVACLDADSGATRWVRYICEANTTANLFSSPSPEINHRLLTLDGSSLYYQTNLGAVVALDIEAGGIRWLATYPWQGRNGQGAAPDQRDLNPAVVHDGLVIVAPDDAPSLYAFDAATGRMVWKTRPVEDVQIAHVLGVARGHVVATGDRVLLFDVRTGNLAHAWPDSRQPLQGFGRGVLAGDRIYWPTQTDIHVLDQETGGPAEAPIKLGPHQAKGGNLAVGDGFLVVAGAESLVVFCQNRRLMERYREEIARAPEKAVNYYRLAQAAEATGLDDEALANFEQVLERGRPSETIDGLTLVESARDHQHHLLMKQGDAARKAKDPARATARFARAAEVARADRDRLAARLALAEVELDSGRPAVAASTLQSLLADERLRPLVVPAGDGLRSVRADLLIADRLAAIVREHGRGAYAEYDRAADDLLERGIKGRDPRLLADVGRSYPAARAMPEALLALGGLFARLSQHQEAARAYKRLLVADAPDESRARAAWGLARSYEAQRLWAPARDAYLRAASRFGDLAIDAGAGGKGRLADLVAARLAAAPFDRMAGDAAEPTLPLPLGRRWGRQWPASIRPLAADGVPPSPDQGRIFLVEGNTLRAVDPTTGAPAWSADLGSEPVWAGYLADRLVAATRTKLVALDRSRGAVEWQYDPSSPAPKGPAGPFAARADAVEAPREQATASLQDFRVVGGKVVCLRGDQAILSVDGDTGQVDWAFAPALGRINPRMLVGPERIVLQVRKPNLVLVLDAATGRRRSEFPQADEEEWARDPLPIDDDHLALVADRRTVALFDLKRGIEAWSFRESNDLPKYGPPRLIGDAGRLLVLHNGNELIRLDPMTGKKRWSRPIGAEDLSERPEAFGLAGDRFFFANGSDLAAVSVADGTTAWRRKLIGPERGWSIALTDRCVAAYPNPARLGGDDDLAALPVVFRRRDTGELVQRLVFPVPATDLIVRLAPRGAFVATQSGYWALGDRRDPERP